MRSGMPFLARLRAAMRPAGPAPTTRTGTSEAVEVLIRAMLALKDLEGLAGRCLDGLKGEGVRVPQIRTSSLGINSQRLDKHLRYLVGVRTRPRNCTSIRYTREALSSCSRASRGFVVGAEDVLFGLLQIRRRPNISVNI